MIILLTCVAMAMCAPNNGIHGTISPDDNLLTLLLSLHQTQSFQKMNSMEQNVAIELIAAAETNQVTHYVDAIGMERLLVFFDRTYLTCSKLRLRYM